MRHEWNSSDSPASCLRCGLKDTLIRRDDPCPARDAATCHCGPNEACSRCSTPRPVLNGWGHYEGCPGFEHRGSCTCAQKDGATAAAAVKAPAKMRLDVVSCRCLRGFAILVPGVEAECINCQRVIRHPKDEEKQVVPCAHQWLPQGTGAWCPNCDAVRAPPRDAK